jgi:hypothetical protein
MGGEWFYMIYHRLLCFHFFEERWNDAESAIIRLKELQERKFASPKYSHIAATWLSKTSLSIPERVAVAKFAKWLEDTNEHSTTL